MNPRNIVKDCNARFSAESKSVGTPRIFEVAGVTVRGFWPKNCLLVIIVALRQYLSSQWLFDDAVVHASCDGGNESLLL